jgi:hypothetical protein
MVYVYHELMSLLAKVRFLCSKLNCEFERIEAEYFIISNGIIEYIELRSVSSVRNVRSPCQN